ncbi:hypothetical protein FS749_002809 [Ceratobasidium sp. UAMH 11750]|nr:hypothetical protein FS749_002809 [Ceratobasidium sp. UAMH 11750]
MMPVTAHQRHLYHGHRRIYGFQCPGCQYRFSTAQIEHYSNVIRARRHRRHGHRIAVRQLRMFIEVVRSQIDWEGDWISMDELYRIIEHVSQMNDEDIMDVDNSTPLAIHNVLDHLESLSLN